MSRWTILRETGRRGAKGGVYVMAHCACGTEREVLRSNILRGHSQSCGCLQREVTGNQARSHGRSGTRVYYAWIEMWQRCTNPSNKKWARYGGRGITATERWRDFATFIADMGERPEGASLDRINNDGDYEPDNCRWATSAEQHANRSHCPTCSCEPRAIRVLSEGVTP